ncbi:MAG: cell surface protein SprA [Ferruginibacter sp.]|nr:cell surface protein SprA [Ferruginibacter sp.]
MLLIKKLFPVLLICVSVLSVFAIPTTNNKTYKAFDVSKNIVDTPPPTLHYPINDTRSDAVSANNKGTFYLKNPTNYNDSVVYNSSTRTYTVYEKIGNKYYRIPTTYSFDEFWAMRNKQAENDYFKKRANTTNLLNRGKLLKPKLSLTDNLFNRLFGTGKIDITPQGSVDLVLGYQKQLIDNPTLPERNRKNGGLDFQPNIQLNVNANIGDKLKFPINYNTLANFNLDNQIKLDYSGKDDDIIKRFEAGSVSFASKGTLIPGAQQLFGVKTQLQFGKLFITGILASQKSQRQNVNLQGGSSAQNFEIRADEYEENRHFLLAQYFRDNYNNAMKNAPAIISKVQILKLQVWVTNRNGTTTETRDVVGLMDLGERNPFLPAPIINVLLTTPEPKNETNDLLRNIRNLTDARNPAGIFTKLLGLQLSPVQDFEKFYARKLDYNSYTYNPQLGTISLSSPLQTDEVLGVAFQYSYNGKIYQVGEFSEDVPPDTSTATQKVLFLKLLKATSQRVNLPIWKLMMKNVYSVGYGTLTKENFKLDVLYEQPGLGAKRYVPFGNKNQGAPIISLVNLDRLNSQNDPQPDGVFDYMDSLTVLSQYSRVIFPVLEPFGKDLAPQVYNVVPTNVRDTLFYALYDSIKAVAQQFPTLNRFLLKGSAKTSGSGDISIGYNIPRGSVSVTAGGRALQEGLDYDINYDLGTIKIINPAILNAGLPVQVNFENNASFGLQQKSFLGLRLDYLAKNTAKTQLALGGTIVRLSERPFFTKVNLGEDPIRNAMYGVDVSYKNNLPKLTKILDKLPFYKTTAPSSVNAYFEGAVLKPGHAKQIGKGSKGVIYIDDFEGVKSGIDLRFPATAWGLASTPKGGTPLFAEADSSNSLIYGKNRAKLAWYQIEQVLQTIGNGNPITDYNIVHDPRVRAVYQKEIFPQRTTGIGDYQLQTFDLAYYPKEKGPYNYDDVNINAQGNLLNPTARWGGIQRNIDQTDFETANIEFIEGWIQDPFINNPSSTGGKLIFNLGNVSEDALKDGRRQYENGITTPNAPSPMDTSVWGRVPRNPIQVTNAFTNNADDRVYQDVGFDGLIDSAENRVRQPYLNKIATTYGVSSVAYNKALEDPSNDNFKHYRTDFTNANESLLARYKNYNGTEGNSKIQNGNVVTSSAATPYPDAEDFNRDNTMNETEEYYQYTLNLRPSTDPLMSVGQQFIVDRKTVTIPSLNGPSRQETWYQIRIPINAYDKKIGNIPDFKSIRFMRMYMTGFDDTAVVRFATLQLSRNIWRNYKYAIDATGNPSPASGTAFNVGAVNIEENDTRDPLPYRTPSDIQRQQSLSNNGVNLLSNEQALTLQFTNLKKGDAKGVFQTFSNKDLRQFKKLSMYLHAEEAKPGDPPKLKDNDLTAVFRLGSDFINNYYEIRIPLRNTPFSAKNLDLNDTAYNNALWNPLNSLDVDLITLTQIKQERNLSSQPLNVIYKKPQPNGQTYAVMGNPNLGEIKGMLIGVENTGATPSASGEIWANELRLSTLDEKGGYAALLRVDFALADLGTLSVSGNMHTQGFGTLEQRVNERYRDNFYQFDVATNLALGKLLPKKARVEIPFFAQYTRSVSAPQYDPYDLDIKLKDKLKSAPSNQKDSIRKTAVTYQSIKTVNFTNVHRVRKENKKPKIYDIANVDLSYSYVKTSDYNPLIEYNDVTRHRAVVGYNFAPTPKYVSPFKALLKKQKSKWFDVVKDFNFNLIPSQLSFRADIQRQFGVIKPRSLGGEKYQTPETYDKYLLYQRDYILQWKLTKSINIDYTATNNSRVDEPAGRLDTKAKKDSIWTNLFRGGRNTVFNQTTSLSYTLPINKIPIFDFVTANIKYQATYKWLGASRLAYNLGNVLENGNQAEGTVQMDFNRLYQKSKFLRQLDAPSNKADREKWRNRWTKITDSVTNKQGKRVLRIRKILDKSAVPYVGGPIKFLGKLITSLKQANISISEQAHTTLPGYTDSTTALGQNFKSMAPGFDFVFGKQVDSNWLNRKAATGLITKDADFNYLFRQNFDQSFTASATLEPIRDLNITINFKKTFAKDYSETFKYADTTGGTNFKYMHLTPYSNGSFDVSYIAFKTLFGKFDPNRVPETFKTFQDNRIILSKRLGALNPYTNTLPNGGKQADGYYYGYGKYAVDVLIPSFIAAYTGKNPETVSLIKQTDSRTRSNPFKAILPKPNWTLDYNGLSKVKGIDKIFTNINITHGYNGSLSMNGFSSALLYQDVSRFGYPSFFDTVSKAYIPFFLVPNVTIQEQFSPLVGIDMQFVNQLQAKFEYTKSRTLSLSLYDYQLSEQRSTEYKIGAGFRKRGIPLLGGLKLPKFLGGGKKLENEMAFRFDYGVRDNVTANSKLDQDNNFATAGSKEITLRPSIDYTLNNRISLKFYYDRVKIKPYISSSAPTTNTRFGVQVHISLAQ